VSSHSWIPGYSSTLDDVDIRSWVCARCGATSSLPAGSVPSPDAVIRFWRPDGSYYGEGGCDESVLVDVMET
jgi:hypothetical protein